MAQQPNRHILVITLFDNSDDFITQLTGNDKKVTESYLHLGCLKVLKREAFKYESFIYQFTGLAGFDQINYRTMDEKKKSHICEELRLLQCSKATLILFVVRKNDEWWQICNNIYNLIRDACYREVPVVCVVSDCTSEVDARHWKNHNQKFLTANTLPLKEICGLWNSQKSHILTEEIWETIENISLDTEKAESYKNSIDKKSGQQQSVSKASPKSENTSIDKNNVPSKGGKIPI